MLRARNNNRDLGDDLAWVAGIQLGQIKKKGDWLVKADFRQVGLGAIDPNLNDSDWGDSFLNQQGVKVVGSYSFTDFLVGSITVYDTWGAQERALLRSESLGSAVGQRRQRIDGRPDGPRGSEPGAARRRRSAVEVLIG